MDDRGGVLAEIDRSWRGFGYEVMHFCFGDVFLVI